MIELPPVTPNDLLMIIGENEVTRRQMAARITELERELENLRPDGQTSGDGDDQA